MLICLSVFCLITCSELKALFSTYGTVKRVRIPKKLGNVHRGFAFVDMASSQEAQEARKHLSHTHFYGRHLVIEEAKPTDTDEADTAEEEVSLSYNHRNSNAGASATGQLKELRQKARKDEKIVSRLNAQHQSERSVKRAKLDDQNNFP